MGKKAISLIVVMATICSTLTLTSCSKNSASSNNDSNSKNGQQITLTYSGWGSTNERDSTANAIKEFEKANPNIKVNYDYIPSDYQTKMATLIAAGSEPDVSMLQKEDSLSWGEKGKLYNLKTFLDKDKEVSVDSYIPGSFQYLDSNTIVGLTPCQETFGLFYNKDLVKAAGISLPAKASDALSWNDFVKACQKLTIDDNGKKANESGFNPLKIKQYGVYLDTGCWVAFLSINNTSLAKTDGTGLNITDPSVTDCLQKFADLVNVYHVAPSPVVQKSMPTSQVSLETGKVAMVYDGQWVLQDVGNSGINYDCAVLPKMASCKDVLYGEEESIFKDTKHPEEAWKLLKWICEPSHMIKLDSSGLWMPTQKNYYTDSNKLSEWADVKPGHSAGYKDAIMDQALNNSVWTCGYYMKNSSAIMNILTPALDDVWLGKQTAAQAMKNIYPKAEAEWKGMYSSAITK